MAMLEFSNAYLIVNGVVTATSVPAIQDLLDFDSYVVTDGDDLLSGRGDSFELGLVDNGSTSDTIDASYVGTNASGDVYGDLTINLPSPVPDIDVRILLSNEAYLVSENPPGPTNNDVVICFAAGTLIDTPAGPRPVEALGIGDPVLTRDAGTQHIRWIGHRHIPAATLAFNRQLCPITVAPGALGNDAALVLSPHHRLLLSGWRAEALFGQAEVLVAAQDLINDSTVRRSVPEAGVDYWHFCFDAHQMVWANGCLAESLNPTEAALGAAGPAARAEILEIFPELRNRPTDPAPLGTAVAADDSLTLG